MKRVCVWGVVAVLALTLCLVAASTASASPPQPSFKGIWWSIDVDDSYQTLVIQPRGKQSGSYNISYFDDGASVCGVDADGDPLYPGMGRGKGTANGTSLTGGIDFWCLSRPRWYEGYHQLELTYNATDDTLTDAYGIVWYRLGGR